jgi:alpha-tubulin suppressor-like RCC1 family protein
MALRAIKCSAVVCGYSSTFVLAEDGSTYSWGAADNNILGHGDSQQLTIPREIISLRPTRSMLVDSIIPCTYSAYAL